MANQKGNMKIIRENTPNNIYLLFGDISIGALPIFIRFLILILKGDPIQLYSDFLICSLLITVVSFVRLIAPITDNGQYEDFDISKRKFNFGMILLFLYIFVYALILYISESIGIDINKCLYLFSIFVNFLFSTVCSLNIPNCEQTVITK